MKKVLLKAAVTGVIIVAGAAILMSNKAKTDKTSSDVEDTSSQNFKDNSNNSTTTACPAPPANTVVYCKGKFNDLTVPAGTTVTFRNDSDRVVQPDSNPHPQHTDNSELNVGFMNPGQVKTVTLNKKGTWNIHNHIRDEEMAKITVQ